MNIMKRMIITCVTLIALSAFAVSAQEKYITAGIDHVTVFSQGAQLNSMIPLTLQPGTIDIVAGGLSPYIDPNSIQVKGEGDFMILGVNHRNNYLENASESATVKELRAKIDAISIKIEDEEAAIAVLMDKEAFLKANYDVVTNKTTITSDQVKAFLDLYSSTAESVKTSMLKKRRLVKEYVKEKQQLENQLNVSASRAMLPTGEIVMTLSCSKAVTGRLRISYVVMNAGWYPSYDIRVDDISSPASVVYKANIYQTSGTDWKDVKVSLSNSSPMTAGILPVIQPWFIDFYQPVVYAEKSVRVRGLASMPMARDKKAEMMAMDMEAEAAPPPVSVSETAIGFSFDVNVTQTILSDGKPETVELQRLTVPATYSYEAVPKINPSAYLAGYITGWEKYNLLAGESNIYFSNTFTGKGHINTGELTDTLTVSLGADNSVTVKREKRVDFSSQKLIGVNRVVTSSFVISVRNNKKQPIDLRLRDQVPLSQNSNITVEAAELSGGRHNAVTGEVIWDLRLAPAENKDVILTYTVRYPKNQKVILE